MANGYKRNGPLSGLSERLSGGPNLLQVIIGPRQVGKTTAIRQFLSETSIPSVYATADLLAPPSTGWIAGRWAEARELCERGGGVLLVFDEVQKIPRWSEAVKRFHDEDVFSHSRLRTVILGSSSLLVQKGLNESLAGRFELIPFRHWSFAECREAFGVDLEHFVFFGGYPGAIALLLAAGGDEVRWQQYVRDALIEPVLGRDILLMNPIEKPALLRQVFHLACAHPAEILAFAKMVGQLQDAGNATTVASYLDLLGSAGLVVPLSRFSGSVVRQRASSPKILILDNALTNAAVGREFDVAKADGARWGRLAENAVGAHLYNLLSHRGAALHYWRERGDEVDFVVKKGETIVGVEVKSGRAKIGKGIQAFCKRFKGSKALVVGGDEMPLEEFLLGDPYPVLFGWPNGAPRDGVPN
ncbi:MAG: ATP-binding protein [Deltaproteobacteria bacterium]|nr:ATP-binding protein [Deltaproteobacteria bacterium]